MTRTKAPPCPRVEAVFYRDLLCDRCHLAALHLEIARQELSPWFSFRIRPYPLRLVPRDLSRGDGGGTETASRVSSSMTGAKPCATSGGGFIGRDQGIMAMAAVEAAYFQSHRAARELDRALRGAFFESGQDVDNLDVILGLASDLPRPELDLIRLKRDLSPASGTGWSTRILDRRNHAVSVGVSVAPALVIGEWVLSEPGHFETYGDVVSQALAQAIGNSDHGPRA